MNEALFRECDSLCKLNWSFYYANNPERPALLYRQKTYIDITQQFLGRHRDMSSDRARIEVPGSFLSRETTGIGMK